jgi:drug/metabolite transporter (DMT)-like permease
VAIDPAHGWWLMGLALTGFAGQVAITEAFRHGQASAVAPFEYSALAWAIALDWLIWTVLPDGYTLAGAAVIVASGLFLLRREKAQAN